MENEIKKVYDPMDIKKMLGIGRASVYEFIEEVYKTQSPFIVIKVGKLYKIPKEPFNKWINGESIA
jgi:hypothetical protein